MPVSSRVVSRTPRSSSSESSRSESSRNNRAQPAKTSVSTSASAKPSARKTKSVPVPPTPASPPKSVRAKTAVEKKPAADTADNTTILIAPTVKRMRVPADLAERYGENRKERKVVEAVPVAEKKARKTAEQREKLRQLMTPDDDILQRLARVASGPSRPAPRQKKVARSKSEWESRCGKCGIVGSFSTPAALCAKCGAITVRVLD